jgi:hypothetical protein
MQSNLPNWLTVHPVSAEDAVAAATLRSGAAPMKGRTTGTAGREPFNAIMERVAPPSRVTFEEAAAKALKDSGASSGTTGTRKVNLVQRRESTTCPTPFLLY